MTSDIGIIGGADGPTTIILSGNPIVPAVCLLLTAADVTVLVFLLRKKKK